MLGPLLQPVAQLFHVMESRLEHGVAHGALVLIHGNRGLELANFVAQLLHNHVCFHGIHKHGNVHGQIQVDDRREPVRGQVPGISQDKERAGKFAGHFEVRGLNLHSRGRDQIFQGSDPLFKLFLRLQQLMTDGFFSFIFLFGATQSHVRAWT